ncbi:MAG: beta-N-acetylhexosaminidase [Planctomycetaceae bacterium]|jgi:hexosaminidase|nr:beta-N-acetylhexosaminidase [Planctomycetaceae bacterium]
MKHLLSVICAAALCVSGFTQYAGADINVVPLPKEVKPLQGQFTLDENTVINYSAETKEAAGFLADWLKLSGSNVRSTVLNTSPAKNSILFQSGGKKYPDGGYTLIIKPENITVLSSNSAGWFYAAQTLRQLFSESKTTDAVEIDDAPRFVWRGFLLDISRHFFDKEQIKRHIDRMAMYKLNSLQFHLSDDQAWRIEIKRYPKLIEIGSIGECGNPKAPSRFLTQTDFKEIIEYAAKRHIRIVPETEMPAHIGSAVRSYPEIACNPNRLTGMCCPGKDATLRFLEGMLDEICEVFPSQFIHIGGDECSKAEWKNCPDCQKRMKDNNLKDYNELQSWFIRHFDKYLADKGRRLIGWDEILEGGLAPAATVMSWRGKDHGRAANKGGLAAAKMGHEVVFTPTDYCYFDAAQFVPPFEDAQSRKALNDGHRYAGYHPITVEKIFSYDPAEGFSPEEAAKILGVQANMWTESCGTEPDMEWKVFPRLIALAEVAWVQPANKDAAGFMKRLATAREQLVKQGISAAPLKWEPAGK